MTGIVILIVLALALVAALERSHRRHGSRLAEGPNGSSSAGDRDLARSRLDLLALGATAEPFVHKPMSARTRRRAYLHLHLHPRGRHAA